MKSYILPLLLLLPTACAGRIWNPVLTGMRDGSIITELNADDDDYNSQAPEGFETSPSNRWVLFYYEPDVAPDVHASFSKLNDLCFLKRLPNPDAEGEEDATRHAALCAFERVPPIPEEEQMK